MKEIETRNQKRITAFITKMQKRHLNCASEKEDKYMGDDKKRK